MSEGSFQKSEWDCNNTLCRESFCVVFAVMFALLRAFDLICFMNMIDYYFLEIEGSVCVYSQGS